MPTHKKGHDKDKYYHLAKDQGFRSRAAFKLIQINKRFDILSKARVCIDLCAAPGGWCQVAAKYMPSGSIILGIDLLPIRSIRNVKTIVSDITTSECRKMVAAELQGWKADVVLCDGAPNIGAAYAKDAYVQNELVLAALKTATDHLTEGGTFCTKVYRSVDYNAIVWVLQQLFEDVQAMKPNSSRSQSSEIFLVCLKYTAPKRIDPKLLDPNHVFKEVADPGLQKVDVLHKKYEKLNKRHRTGYDESLGVLLRSTASVTEFIESTDPVRMLTDKNVFEFSPECDMYKSHELTSTEICECFKDLRVLGKIDFKKILKWRQNMRKFFSKDGTESGSVKSKDKVEVVLSEEEQLLQELEEHKVKESQLQRKEKKKSRAKLAKERARQQLGMSNNAFEEAPDMELFSFSESGAAAAAGSVDILHDILHDSVDYFEPEGDIGNVGSDDDDDDDDGIGKTGANGLVEYDEEELEKELEEDYRRYRQRRKSPAANEEEAMKMSRTQEAKRKRQRLTSDGIVAEQGAFDASIEEEDEDDFGQEANASGSHRAPKTGLHAAVKGDISAYLELLTKGSQKKSHDSKLDGAAGSTSADVSSDDSDSDADGVHNDDDDEDVWFSHPIFKETTVSDLKAAQAKKVGGRNEPRDSAAALAMIAEMPKTDKAIRKEKRLKATARKERRANRKMEADDEEGVAASMAFEIIPAGKEGGASAPAVKGTSEDGHGGILSHEQKELLRQGMGKVLKNGGRSGGRAGDDDDIEIVSAEDTRLAAKKRARVLLEQDEVGPGSRVAVKAGGTVGSKRDLATPAVGSGGTTTEADGEDTEYEEVGEYEGPADGREYDSDNEVYDSQDRLMTLALGTLMLRGSRKKALVDASYNRFAWNDPKALPSWFMEDEVKHNKPQLPVPTALLDQIKNRFQITNTKEIKKVAEARARKRKRAVTQLKSAKKKANAMAESSELSGREKVKAIAKAMKGTSKTNKPSKVYVVTRKTGGASSGTKGSGSGPLKFVDKRMKKEARAVRAKKKRGKK